MKKIILISLLLSTSNLYAANLKRMQKKLSRSIEINIDIADSLLKSKDHCTHLMLESWQNWWDQVESPYKEQYLKKLKALSKIEIKTSTESQTITGKQEQLYLVKTVCTGGPLSRSCKSLDSRSIRLNPNLIINGETPQFEMNLGTNAQIHLEYSKDSSALKRFDTFTQMVFYKVEEDNTLFKKYHLGGLISQVIKPGTDISERLICSKPSFSDLIEKL